MTDKAEHTPGPWSLNGKHAPWICTVGNNIDDPAIFGRPVADGETYLFGDKLADARLIAAAPELLEVLEAILGGSGATVQPYARLEYGVAEKARAAIAKARGR